MFNSAPTRLAAALLLAATPALAKKKPAHGTAKTSSKAADKHTDKHASAPKAEPKTAASEVIARYLAAIGGPSFHDLQSRRMTGEVEYTPAGGATQKAQLELAWKAPGKARELWQLPQGRLKRVFDGKKGWVQGPAIKKRRLQAAERAELSRLAALFQPALILPLDALEVEKSEVTAGRTLNVLKDKNGDFACFDALTGLPARLELIEERPEPERAGEFGLTQVYFDDWKFVGAIQVPHTIRRVRPQGETVYRLSDVQQNVDTPDKLFKKPMFWRK